MKKQIKTQIENKEKQIKKLQEEISNLKLQEESSFIETKHDGKVFRIYKHESRPVKDFVIPKGFRMAEEYEFVDLYDSGFKIKQYPIVYFTKNKSKLNIENGFSLSRVNLYYDLDLVTGGVNLGGSGVGGRVVVVRIK